MADNSLGYYGPGHDPFDNATLRRSKEALGQAQAILAQAEATRQETIRLMTQAIWCDVGDHAFSAKDKKKRSIAMTQWDEDKQEDVQELVMVCGPCSSVNPLLQAAHPDKPVPAAELAAGPRKYDPDYTARLERETRGPIPGQ